MKSLEMPIRQGGDGMSGKSIISNSHLEDIGDAIRYKKGSEDTYYPSQMGDAIRSIEGIIPAGTLEIEANGTYDVTEYAEAVVNIPESTELYPVCTDIVAKYLGRKWNNGQGLFVHGKYSSTGGMTQTDVDTDMGLCMVYLPIDPSYTYVKSDQGRINIGFYYDENKNFISNFSYNNLNWVTFTNVPANAKYLRFATLNLTNNWDIAIFRTA